MKSCSVGHDTSTWAAAQALHTNSVHVWPPQMLEVRPVMAS
ncbi:MAG: hypothetical protein HW394_1113, partial [Acidobacteria bacterium]|nr:hypothetical protein [Acidobacteriota bacterium]